MESFIRKLENALFPARNIKALTAEHNAMCQDLTSTMREMTQMTMKIRIERDAVTEAFTAGKMFVDGEFQCFTLEDPVREKEGVPVEQWKLKGETAIPKGNYKLVVAESPRFKKELPRLVDVPGFEGVLIHSGNSVADTEGCILVGIARDLHKGVVTQSRDAMAALFNKIKSALAEGRTVEVEIA